MITQFFRLVGNRKATTRMLAGHALGGVFQGIAIGLLIPFLSRFLAGQPAWGWLVAVLGAAALSVGFSITASLQSMAIACLDVCGTLICRVAERVQKLPLGWFSAASVGRVSKAASRDVSFLSHMPSIALPYIASASGSLVGIFLVTVLVDWRVAVVMVVPMPVALWALRWMRRMVVREHQVHAVELHRLSNRIVEFAQLQPILRATDRCRNGWEPLEKALASERDAMFTAGKAKGPAGSVFHTAVSAGMLGSIAVGIALLFAGSMTAPVFIALALMAARFAEPVGMLAFYVDALHEAQVAMDAIEDITGAPLLPVPAAGAEKTAGAPFDICFEGVDFSYDEAGSAAGTDAAPNSVPAPHPHSAPNLRARAPRQVLRNVSFTVPAGSVTAVVGPSGSGKSTLSRLTARFWDVSAGRITVGGVDVRDMTDEHLMSLMSMVFQDVYLFDTTIEENVRIGRMGASDAEVRQAAERAALTEVIERLPQGWQTRVGEGGAALSGGERQRVALARAFLKDAPILLLDEVTSALDGVNEARVTESLNDLAEGRTVLVIAHRLSTIRRADQIVVLTDGAIEAVGSHEVLYEDYPTYREFWEDQSAVARWKL